MGRYHTLIYTQRGLSQRKEDERSHSTECPAALDETCADLKEKFVFAVHVCGSCVLCRVVVVGFHD